MLGQIKTMVSNTKSQQPAKEEIVKAEEASMELNEADLMQVAGGAAADIILQKKSNIWVQ